MDCRDRVRMYPKWYKSFDARKRTIIISLSYEDEDDGDFEEDVEFPMKFEVCPLCHGKGKHVNPSIDAHGISREEFADDPDFMEDYLSGYYDVDCYECDGHNVVPEIDDNSSRMTDELKEKLKQFREYQKEEAKYRRICEMETRMCGNIY